MNALFTAIGRFSVRFRWLVLVGWLAVTVAVAAFFPTLASVTKANNTDFLPAKTPSMVAARLATPFQGSNLTSVPVVVYRSGAALTNADTTAVDQLIGALRRVPDMVSVKDLGRSRDGQAEQLLTLANVPVGGQNAGTSLVREMRSAAATVSLPAGLQEHLAGQLATSVDQQNKSGGTGNKVQLLVVVFILVLLFVIFRSILAPILTLAPAFLVTQLAGPVIAEATKAGLQVSLLTQLMLIVLVLGAGTDYGLFLVFRVREEIRRGRGHRDAVAYAVSRVGESITFSAGTVIAALLSLLAATFGIYSSLGAPLAIGIGLMLLAGLTLQPALLAIFGRAVFWPSHPKPGAVTTGLWGRVSARIVQRPVATLAIGLVAFGGLAVASLAYQAAGFGNSLAAPAGSDSAAGNAALAAHFPAAAANPTNVLIRFTTPVWDDPAVLATLQRELAAAPVFAAVSGPLNPNGIPLPAAELVALHDRFGSPDTAPATPPAGISAQLWHAFQATGGYVSPDGRTLNFNTSLTAGDPSTTKALNAVPAIRAAVARAAASVHAQAYGVAGEAPGIYDVSTVSNNDLVHVIPLAIVVIGVLLALVMRSLVAPLYLIASVALSYLAALGLAVLLFQYAAGLGGLTFILPFLMFLFLLALGEDYNILVMTRIREEAHDLPLREAVRHAVAATGTTVTSAGLVLAGTFAVFALASVGTSGSSQFIDVGVGLALGILMDTFLVRTLLVPSTVVLLDRWNWWPSRLGDRHRELPEAATSVRAGAQT